MRRKAVYNVQSIIQARKERLVENDDFPIIDEPQKY